MYKLILEVFTKQGTKITKIFTNSELNYLRGLLKTLKDRYNSIGWKIVELKLYKVEQIQDPEQI